MELTISVFAAPGAVCGMGGNDKLGCALPKAGDFGSGSLYFHSLEGHFGAGHDRPGLSFHFHEAEPARGRRDLPFPERAEVGNVNAVVQGDP